MYTQLLHFRRQRAEDREMIDSVAKIKVNPLVINVSVHCKIILEDTYIAVITVLIYFSTTLYQLFLQI
jgi:hypothetical protein